MLLICVALPPSRLCPNSCQCTIDCRLLISMAWLSGKLVIPRGRHRPLENSYPGASEHVIPTLLTFSASGSFPQQGAIYGSIYTPPRYLTWWVAWWWTWFASFHIRHHHILMCQYCRHMYVHCNKHNVKRFAFVRSRIHQSPLTVQINPQWFASSHIGHLRIL